MNNENITEVFLSQRIRELQKISPYVHIGTPKEVIEAVDLAWETTRRELTKAEISRLLHLKNITIYSVYKPIQWQCLI